MRGAHQAFFLDDDEKTRAVELLRRVEEAKLLEYSRPTGKYVSRFGEYRRSFLRRMWNSSEFMRTYKQHFTMSFNGRGTSSDRRDPSRSKADQGLKAPKGYSVELERGNPAVAERILELLAEDGPMRPSALRKAVGIRSSIHFNRYYLSPLQEKGIIARTDPDHPQSPQQRYSLT